MAKIKLKQDRELKKCDTDICGVARCKLGSSVILDQDILSTKCDVGLCDKHWGKYCEEKQNRRKNEL